MSCKPQSRARLLPRIHIARAQDPSVAQRQAALREPSARGRAPGGERSYLLRRALRARSQVGLGQTRGEEAPGRTSVAPNGRSRTPGARGRPSAPSFRTSCGQRRPRLMKRSTRPADPSTLPSGKAGTPCWRTPPPCGTPSQIPSAPPRRSSTGQVAHPAAPPSRPRRQTRPLGRPANVNTKKLRRRNVAGPAAGFALRQPDDLPLWGTTPTSAGTAPAPRHPRTGHRTVRRGRALAPHPRHLPPSTVRT